MYYHKLTNRLIFDALDYFFISAFLMSSFTLYVKNSWSEKASRKRLRKERKIQKIYKFALETHGGWADEDPLADASKNQVLQLAIFLKKKERKAKLFKLILTQGRLILPLLLERCNMNLPYLVLDPVSPEIAVMASCVGGTTGLVCSWFSVGALLFAPPTIFSVFLMRSLFQQIGENLESTKRKTAMARLFKDENLKEELTEMLRDDQKRIEKWMNNSKAIELESFHWNPNPAIPQDAGRLGILENPPSAHGPLHVETLDPDRKKMVEEVGWIQTPNPEKFTKARTVYFRDYGVWIWILWIDVRMS